MGAFLAGALGPITGKVKDKRKDKKGSKKKDVERGAPVLRRKNTSSSSSGDDGDSYKHGGTVRKTGPAKLHKGELVLTKKQASKYKGKKRY